MNLDLDRRVTAVNRPSRPVDGDSRGGWLGVRCFQVRKRIRVDVPNKSTHLHFKFHIGFMYVQFNWPKLLQPLFVTFSRFFFRYRVLLLKAHRF